MRSIEQIAYALYLADYHETDPRLERPLLEWLDLDEEARQIYLRHAEASLRHLFEHGRIISYISTQQRYEELSSQYQAYLAAKIKSGLEVRHSDLGEITEGRGTQP
jgi:hypothetical protein